MRLLPAMIARSGLVRPRKSAEPVRVEVPWRHTKWPARSIHQHVVSFPKAGRTWLRVLMGAADAAAQGLDLPERVGEWLNEEAPVLGGRRLLFTHGLAEEADEPVAHLRLFLRYIGEQRRVFLVRDPRDVVVSYYFQRSKRQHRGWRVPESLSDFVRDRGYGIERILHAMRACQESIAEDPGPVLLLSYEALHADPAAHLQQALEFFGVGPVVRAELEQAVEYGRFENMRKLEASGGLGAAKNRLRNPNSADPESWKTRKGVVGGFREYLGADDLDYVERRIAVLAPPELGYRTPGAAPRPFAREARA